jgi:hypothetical protein
MKVTALKNIDSLKYGLVGQGEEKEVDEEIALIWIKQGLAHGTDNSEGDQGIKGKVKKP